MGLNLYLIFALASTSFLGLIKILSIVPFNRMAADDFSFTVSLLNNNVFSFVRAWYISLTARYTANILIGSFGILSGPSAKPFVFTLLTVILGFFSLAFFISSLTKIKLLDWKNILIACILLVAYYVITPSQRESWYWLNSAATYLWPTFIDLIIISILLRKYKSWWVYILLFALTFLAGGTNECILVINFLISGLTVVYLLVGKCGGSRLGVFFQKIAKNIKSSSPLLKQIWLVFLATTLSLTIIYLSPGNSSRMQSSTSSPMSLFGSLAYSFRDGPLLVWKIFKNNVLFIIPLFVTLTYLFSKFITKGNKLDRKNKESYLNKVLFTISVPLFLSVVFTLIGYLSLGRMLEVRAFVTVSFLILISLILVSYFMSFLVYSLGKSAQKWFSGMVLISSILIFISGFQIVSTLAEDVYIARNYSQAFDRMFADLRDLPAIKEHKIIEVKQLPPSGLVKFWQVTGNPEDWENQIVPTFLKINATLVAN